jgi:hypothetical protein
MFEVLIICLVIVIILLFQICAILRRGNKIKEDILKQLKK